MSGNMDALGTIGTLPKKIGDVTTSISKGADSLDKMVGKMDAAIKGVPTYNPVSLPGQRHRRPERDRQ